MEIGGGRVTEEDGWLDKAVGRARRRDGTRRLAAGREGIGKHEVRGRMEMIKQ